MRNGSGRSRSSRRRMAGCGTGRKSLCPANSMSSQEGSPGFDQCYRQRHRLNWRRPETVPLIEAFSLERDGVDQHRAHSNCFPGGEYAQRRVAKKIATQTPALPAAIERQAPEQHSRYWIGHVPPHPPCRGTGQQRTRGETVVAHDTKPGANDEGPRAAFCFVVVGMTFQPIIERLDAALKSVQNMFGCERSPGRKFRDARRHASQAGLRASNARSRGLSAGGASSAALNSSHCRSSSTNNRRSAKVSCAACSPLSSKNSVSVLLEIAAACCSTCLAVGVIRKSTRSERTSVVGAIMVSFRSQNTVGTSSGKE